MLHNYKSFTLIFESNAREKKIEKVVDKIKLFANIPTIYNWAIDKCINDRSTEGIQFAVWVANIIKKECVDSLLATIGEKHNIKKSEIEKLFKTGKDDKLEKIIETEWNKLNICIDRVIETLNDDINYILDWLKNPLRTELINLSELSFESALEKSKEWHNSLKATGKITDESGEIFIEFDDGFYWIDLQTTYSADEAEAMGHCGNTNDGDTLFSLRDKNKSPHVTVAYDSSDGAIYQMKGRNNKKPIDKYHPYIYRLLVDPDLKPKYFGYEWNKEEDFNLSDFDKETFDKVYKYNSNLIYESVNYDSDMVRGLIKKNYLDKEDVKDVIMNSKEVSSKVFLQVMDLELYEYEELITLFNNSDINIKELGELAWLKLYDKKIIDLKKLEEKFSEIEIVDNIGYVYYDKEDLDKFMSYGVANILFSEDWYEYGHENNMESSDDVWRDLSKETKEKVLEETIGKKINYSENGDDIFSNIEITKDMIKWTGKDFYFIYDDEEYSIDDIIDQNKYDELEDIYDKLSSALNHAQNIADEDEYYKIAKSELGDILGDFTVDTNVITMSDNKKKEITVLKFKADDIINKIDLDDLEEYFKYDGELDYEDEKFGTLLYILQEFLDKKADINDNNRIYGSIDKDILNDCVIDQF